MLDICLKYNIFVILLYYIIIILSLIYFKGVKMNDNTKINELLEKYEDLFKKTTADIATSLKGKNFFYFVDPRSEELYGVIEFETAEQLEKIILSEYANYFNTIIDVSLQNIEEKIRRIDLSYADCEFGNSINHLAASLDIIHKEFHECFPEIQSLFDAFHKYISNYLQDSN